MIGGRIRFIRIGLGRNEEELDLIYRMDVACLVIPGLVMLYQLS